MNIIKKLLKDKAKAVINNQYKEVVTICNALGNEYCDQEKYEEALVEHLEELNYCQMIEDELGTAVANRKIGECYTSLNKFNKALQHIKKFYDISVKLKSDIETQRAFATFGRTYYVKYQHDKASGNCDNDSLSKTLDQSELAYCRALKLLPCITSEVSPSELAAMKCRLLNNLGLVSEARGNHEKSSKYVKDALDIALKNNLKEDINRCGYSLGTLYQKLAKYMEAEDIFNKILKVTKTLHNKNLTCEVLLAKGINLIYLGRYKDAIKCLKSAYKLHTTNSDDFEKINRSLKVCIGIDDCETKLKNCKKLHEQKEMLEKIADGLSSIDCFDLAIKKYHMTLNCMKQADSPLSEKAPILFSLAQTYLDNGNISKALEYFEEEYKCNKEKPLEQIKTLWKIAEVLENEKEADKSEEFYRKAVLLAEEVGDQKYIYNSLNKLLEFYNNLNKTDLAEEIKKKITKVEQVTGYISDDDEEEDMNEEPFDDIHLSDLSDSDDNEEITSRKRGNKKIESKVNEKGETPLHQACINNNFNLVKRLVQSGHSINVRDNAGWTPLHEACNHDFYNIAEFLIENGADINDPGGPDCNGITPLHDAATGGLFDIIQLLISKGADVSALDENGKTPLDTLLQWKKENLKELDDVSLKQCKAIEDELKLKMAEAGMSVPENIVDNSDSSDYSDIQNQNINVGGKRNRSYSSSSKSGSDSDDDDDDDDIPRISPYITEYDKQNQNDAKTQYKSVMENLRRSAANVNISPVKSKKLKFSGPALVNENEIVNDWLVKDTGNFPKAKRKKRRVNKLNVRTSKCIDRYLVSEISSEEKSARNFSDDSNSSITVVNSVDRNIVKNKEEHQSCFSHKSECSTVAFCLRVNIANKLILVPIPEDTCTINWLKEEAATRFQAIDGSKPHLTLTKNGALLSGSDLIKNIFSNNEEVLSSVEMWDEPSLEDKYVQLCNKHNVIVCSDIKKLFCDLAISFEMNISQYCIPYTHLSILFHTLSNYKSLKHLNLSSTPLSSPSILELVSCVPSLSALHTLNLSCCSLTSEKIKIFLDYLNDQIPKTTVLPSLKIVDLSYNFFSGFPDFTAFFKLSCLCKLNLCSCGLGSTFLSSKFLKAIEENQNLEELDMSENTFKGDVISNFLDHLPKDNLKRLNLKCVVEKKEDLGYKLQKFLLRMPPYLKEINLQGCFLTDVDVNLISTSLTFCPQLQIIDLSANPSLSTNCIVNFINALYQNELLMTDLNNESKFAITDLNITGTCSWEIYHLSSLTKCLELKRLKYLCFDNCPETVTEKIMQLWTEKWKDRAVCTKKFFFCVLSVT